MNEEEKEKRFNELQKKLKELWYSESDYLINLTKKYTDIVFPYLPSKLYKYCSFDEKGYNLDNLKNNCVYMNDPDNFNDPDDTKININGEICKMADGVSCFTTREPQKNLDMWKEYGNNQKGFCIEYNNKKIINKEIINIKFITSISPVIYLDDAILKDPYEGCSEFMEDQKNNKILPKVLLRHLTKDKKWAHEREWRLYSIFTGNTALQKDLIENRLWENIIPNRVFAGAIIEPENKEKLKEICKNKCVLAYLSLSSHKYELEEKEWSYPVG